MAPSVIFIDELDALAPARGGGNSEGGGGGGMAPEPADEMSGRIVTTFLTAMDGINSDTASAGQSNLIVLPCNGSMIGHIQRHANCTATNDVSHLVCSHAFDHISIVHTRLQCTYHAHGPFANGRRMQLGSAKHIAHVWCSSHQVHQPDMLSKPVTLYDLKALRKARFTSLSVQNGVEQCGWAGVQVWW